MNTDYRYLAIDLKSFYASVECIERNMDPLTTNLVVADPGRTNKTICLAVSPTLKAYGISGRARLFEVVKRIEELNRGRKKKIEYIVAPPRMALYLEYSARVYQVYLKYVSREDIHVYSIDEVFIDTKGYLKAAGMDIYKFAAMIMKDVFNTTGITSTAGIGTNLYLAKIAMDIMGKHINPDENGCRIAMLDEKEYKKRLWIYRPITDFWRIGKGYAKRLAGVGLYTMGDIARCSLGKENNYHNEDLLYDIFGVNAELLIDHAWGIEPVTIADIKNYKPEHNSLHSGQVLQEAYDYHKARIVVWEMAQGMALELVDKDLVTNQIVLHIGYDIENLTDPDREKNYEGEIVTDHYGRLVPKPAHGTSSFEEHTNSSDFLTKKTLELFDRIINKNLLIRRFSLAVNHVLKKSEALPEYKQMDLFSLMGDENKEDKLKKEDRLQEAMLSIKHRYGKNAILKGANLQEGATAKDRNRQIGGHRA